MGAMSLNKFSSLKRRIFVELSIATIRDTAYLLGMLLSAVWDLDGDPSHLNSLLLALLDWR